MKEQQLSNHVRLVPFFHFFTVPLALLLLAGSLINLWRSSHANWLPAALLVLTAIVLISCIAFARVFALRAQDRAIRAEENLRHFILTGKPLHPELRLGQIIALRFASDGEFPQLAEKALRENLRNRDIKKSIRDWKADHHRV